MSIYEFFHYSLFLGLFVGLTYFDKQPPAFGAAPAYWSILLAFLGLLFCNLANNLSNYTVLSANAPFFYQISGTWSNHEGSLLLWCWILNFYGFLVCYRSQPQSKNVQGVPRESLFLVFISNFVKKEALSLPGVDQSSGFQSPTLRKASRPRSHLVDSEVRWGRTVASLVDEHTESQKAPLAGCYYAGWRRTNALLDLSRDYEERGSSMDSRRIAGVIGIALFFSAFLAASSDPFVRNFFVCTSPLSSLNPVLQDPILAIHPPCIYAGEVASGVGFVLCRAKLMDGIVAMHSRSMHQSDKHVTVVYSSVCVGWRLLRLKAVGTQRYTASMLRRRIPRQREGYLIGKGLRGQLLIGE